MGRPPSNYKGSSPVQRTTEIRRPRTNQRLTVSFDDSEEADVSGSAARLQYEIAQCVETRTITTTTTTKRSFPPLLIRRPRPLESLDTKEYPLAQGPTPLNLRKFTLDLSETDDDVAWSFNEPAVSHHSDQVGPSLVLTLPLPKCTILTPPLVEASRIRGQQQIGFRAWHARP